MNCQANELPDHLAEQDAFLNDVFSIFKISSKWIAKQMNWLNEAIHNLNHRTTQIIVLKNPYLFPKPYFSAGVSAPAQNYKRIP